MMIESGCHVTPEEAAGAVSKGEKRTQTARREKLKGRQKKRLGRGEKKRFDYFSNYIFIICIALFL